MEQVLETTINTWEVDKTKWKAMEQKKYGMAKTGSNPRPREPEPREEKKSKRRKHDLLKEDWGEEKDEKEPRQLAANSEGNQTQIGGSTSKAINNQACNLRLPIPVKTNLQEGAPPTQVCPSGGNLCEGSLGGWLGRGVTPDLVPY